MLKLRAGIVPTRRYRGKRAKSIQRPTSYKTTTNVIKRHPKQHPTSSNVIQNVIRHPKRHPTIKTSSNVNQRHPKRLDCRMTF